MRDKKYIHAKELIYLMVGFTIGPGFLKLPNSLITIAGQDSYISAFIALLYPFYLCLICLYIIKKYPDNSILEISKNQFGNLLANILNLLFLLQFLLIAPSVVSDFILLSRMYIVPFLSIFKIALICCLVSLYGALKGIKVLSSANKIVFYIIIFAIILSLFALKEGNIRNIKPILDNDIKTILKASLECTYYYSGFEVIPLLHFHVGDKQNIKKYLLLSLVFVGIIWVWTVFITIFYLGIDVAPKAMWSFVLVYESVKFPIINNFRYIFMFSWILVTFRMVSNYIYISSNIICTSLKIKNKLPLFFILLLTIYLSIKFSSMSYHKMILSFITPISIYYSLCYISIIALAVKLKSSR